MRPLYLDMANCGSHARTVIDFASITSAVIVGGNGTGKSTIPEAMLFAMFGRNRGDLDGFIRIGETSLAVGFDFAADGSVYRIIRTRDISTKAGKSTLDFLRRSGSSWETMATGVREAQALIEETIGLNYELATATIFGVQGAADALTAGLDPADRRRYVAQLLGAQRFDDMRRVAAGRETDETTAIERATGKVEGLSLLADTLPDREASLATQLEAFEAAQDLAVAARAVENDARTALDAATAERDQIAAARERFDFARRAENSYTAELADVEQKLTWAQEYIETLNADAPSAATLEGARDTASRLHYAATEDRKAAEYAVESADDVRSDIRDSGAEAASRADVLSRGFEADIRTRKSDALAALTAANVEMNRTAEAQRTARESIAAVERKAQTDYELAVSSADAEAAADRIEYDAAKEAHGRAEHAAGLISEVPCKGSGPFGACKLLLDAKSNEARLPGWAERRDAAAAKADVSRIAAHAIRERGPSVPDATLATLRGLLADFEAAALSASKVHAEAMSAVDDAGTLTVADVATDEWKALRQSQEWCSANEQSVAALLRDLRETSRLATDAAIEAGEAVSRAEKAIADAAAWQGKISAARAEVRNAEAAVVERRERLDASKVESEKHRADAERLPAASFSDAENAWDKAATRRSQEESIAATHRAEVAGAESRVNDAIEAVQQVARVEEGVADRRKRVERLQVLQRAYKDVPGLLIEAVAPEIEDAANRILDRISQSGLSVRIVTQKALKSGTLRETFEINVRDLRGERAYERYSGGEKFRVDWAVRIAVATVLSARAGSPLQAFIWDEGFGSLDDAGIEAYKATLQNIADLFDFMLIVSHIPELAEAFGTRIEMTRGPDDASHCEVVEGS